MNPSRVGSWLFATQASLLIFALCCSSSAFATQPPASPLQPAASQTLDSVFAKLDASAAKFKSAQAEIVWDNVQTQPVEDKDSQVGSILFERVGGEVRLSLHIATENGHPALKEVVYAQGIGKMYQPSIKQMQVFKVADNRDAIETYLTLGFGGSSQEIKKNWKVAYLGSDQVNGKSAAKLELTPLDPKLSQATPKVLLWIDMDLGLAVRQQRFDSQKGYVQFTYSNIRLNPKVPSNAFEIKTAPGTQIVNH